MTKKMKGKPKVRIEWTEGNGICSLAGWEIILPKGYRFDIQMDDCCGTVVDCKPYCIKIIEETD